MFSLPSFSTSDWVAIAFGAAALIVGCIQIWIAEQIAKRSGQLKQAGLKLKFGNFSLEKRTLNIVYGTSWPQDEAHAMILRILIGNDGKRAAEHVKLGIILPAGANQNWENAAFSLRTGISPGFESHAAKIGELLQSDIYIPILAPGESAAFDQPFWLQGATQIFRKIKATTKDNIDVEFTASIWYELKFDITLHSKEDEPVSTSIHIESYPAATIKDLAKHCIENIDRPKSEEIDTMWRKHTLRLKEWIYPNKQEFLLILPSFHSTPVIGNSQSGFEDMNRSERWLLVKRRKWTLQKVTWSFSPH